MFTVAEEFARAIFWFHPAVWWVLGEIQLAREQTVDQVVMDITKAREQYIDALLIMATSGSATENQLDLAPAPLFLRRRHLKRRVVELLREARISPVSRLQTIATNTTAIATIATACWFVSGTFPLDASPQFVADAAGVVVNTGDAKLSYRTPVIYPDEALQKGVQGRVMIEAAIDRDGGLSDKTVVSCPRELCDAAVGSLSDWRFDTRQANTTRQISIDFVRPPGSFATPVDDPEQDQLWVSRMLAQQLSRPKQRIAHQLYAQNTAPAPTFHALTLLLDGAYVMNLAPDQSYGKTLNAVRIAGLPDSTAQLLSRLPVRVGDVWSPTTAGLVNQVVKDFAPGLEADIVKDPASQLSTLWIGPSVPTTGVRAASYADVNSSGRDPQGRSGIRR